MGDDSVFWQSVFGNYHRLMLCLCALLGLQLVLLTIQFAEHVTRYWGVWFLPLWLLHAVALCKAVLWVAQHCHTLPSVYRADQQTRTPLGFALLFLVSASLTLTVTILVVLELNENVVFNSDETIDVHSFNWHLIIGLSGGVVLLWVAYLLRAFVGDLQQSRQRLLREQQEEEPEEFADARRNETEDVSSSESDTGRASSRRTRVLGRAAY